MNQPIKFLKQPMIAAVINQGVSVAVSLATFPMLLSFLNRDEFLSWMLFITFGALTIQIEQAIQTLSVRRLAKFWHSENNNEFYKEMMVAKYYYRILSLSVLILLGIFGLFYFKLWADIFYSDSLILAWILFILSFSINFWFGYNSAILLATGRVSFFNFNNVLVRCTNFLMSLTLLWLGFSILGLAISFTLSVFFQVVLLARAASVQNAKVKSWKVRPNVAKPNDAELPNFRPIILYTIYLLASFGLYKGAFLILPLLPGSGDLTQHGLALQLVALVYAISVIPTQVWLAPLIKAVMTRQLGLIVKNLILSHIFIVFVFVFCFFVFIYIGPITLKVLNSKIQMPDTIFISLFLFAFFIEAIIFTLVNLLLLLEVKYFLLFYINAALITLIAICGLHFLSLGIDLNMTSVLATALIQTIIVLPTAAYLVYRRLQKFHP